MQQSKFHLNMTSIRTITSVVLLLFNGIGAIGGGMMFITDPSGSSMGMHTELLSNSPFSNYLIPGIILFLANGMLSISIAILVIKKHKYAALLIMLQGCILCGWIVIQIYLLQLVSTLHIVMFCTGFLLFLCGVISKYTKS